MEARRALRATEKKEKFTMETWRGWRTMEKKTFSTEDHGEEREIYNGDMERMENHGEKNFHYGGTESTEGHGEEREI